MSRRHFLVWTGELMACTWLQPVLAAGQVNIPPQPYFASANRALEALNKLGAPIAVQDAHRIAALARHDDAAAVDTSVTDACRGPEMTTAFIYISTLRSDLLSRSRTS